MNLGLRMTSMRGLNVHPDGKRMVFQSTGFSTENTKQNYMEIRVMENFLPKESASK
jgi:hypothetical protein